jgi:hypothetical protein
LLLSQPTLFLPANLLTRYNFRDHADWDDEQEQIAKDKVSIQLENPVPEEEQGRKSPNLCSTAC